MGVMGVNEKQVEYFQRPKQHHFLKFFDLLCEPGLVDDSDFSNSTPNHHPLLP
jgi:hypothetical protein